MRAEVNRAIVDVCEMTINFGYRKATKYLAPDYVVKASRSLRQDGRSKVEHVVLTCGKPNYAERKFIKLCQKVGEKFPVKKIQLKSYY